MQKGLTNITDLRWDWAFDTAELLDGTVEIVSVADHDAHNELHIGLEKKEMGGTSVCISTWSNLCCCSNFLMFLHHTINSNDKDRLALHKARCEFGLILQHVLATFKWREKLVLGPDSNICRSWPTTVNRLVTSIGEAANCT